jgi:hypothetical protein
MMVIGEPRVDGQLVELLLEVGVEVNELSNFKGTARLRELL